MWNIGLHEQFLHLPSWRAELCSPYEYARPLLTSSLFFTRSVQSNESKHQSDLFLRCKVRPVSCCILPFLIRSKFSSSLYWLPPDLSKRDLLESPSIQIIKIKLHKRKIGGNPTEILCYRYADYFLRHHQNGLFRDAFLQSLAMIWICHHFSNQIVRKFSRLSLLLKRYWF